MVLPEKDLPKILLRRQRHLASERNRDRREFNRRVVSTQELMKRHAGPRKANPIYDEPDREPINKLAASMFWGTPRFTT